MAANGGTGRLRTRVVVVLITAGTACGLSACAGRGSNEAAHKSSAQSQSTTRSEARTLPQVGAVVIRRGADGIVIRDRATGGQRFRLSGMQAGECLSFLKANPSASPEDVRLACPGETLRAHTKPQETGTVASP